MDKKNFKGIIHNVARTDGSKSDNRFERDSFGWFDTQTTNDLRFMALWKGYTPVRIKGELLQIQKRFLTAWRRFVFSATICETQSGTDQKKGGRSPYSKDDRSLRRRTILFSLATCIVSSCGLSEYSELRKTPQSGIVRSSVTTQFLVPELELSDGQIEPVELKSVNVCDAIDYTISSFFRSVVCETNNYTVSMSVSDTDNSGLVSTVLSILKASGASVVVKDGSLIVSGYGHDVTGSEIQSGDRSFIEDTASNDVTVFDDYVISNTDAQLDTALARLSGRSYYKVSNSAVDQTKLIVEDSYLDVQIVNVGNSWFVFGDTSAVEFIRSTNTVTDVVSVTLDMVVTPSVIEYLKETYPTVFVDSDTASTFISGPEYDAYEVFKIVKSGSHSVRDLKLNLSLFASTSSAGAEITEANLFSAGSDLVIASPSITVASTGSARLVSGRSVPIITKYTDDNGNLVEAAEYRDTGLVFEVTTTALKNERYRIKIFVEMSSVISSTDFPEFSTERFDTSIEVMRGDVIVLSDLAIVDAEFLASLRLKDLKLNAAAKRVSVGMQLSIG